MLNFDHPNVKQGTQNIQNYCNQWLSDISRVHQNSFSAGALLQTPLRELTALPQTT